MTKTSTFRNEPESLTTTSKKQLTFSKELQLKRRSERDAAVKKVMKQWDQLRHTEWFFDQLGAWRSGTDPSCVPDHFLDLVSDAIKDDEHSLDVAVDRLAVANKRLHDLIDAMDPKL
jgi:hypothetical protein